MLLAKAPAQVDVYNDIDGALVNFFRVLRDKPKFEELHRLVSLTPYSKEEFLCAWDAIEYKVNCCDVERAYNFLLCCRMVRSGLVGSRSWAFSVTTSCKHMSANVSKWLACIEDLPEIAVGFMQVQIECEDFEYVLGRYDRPTTLFYLDPPYLNVKSNNPYRFNMTLDDHEIMVDILLELKGMVVLSGYQNDIYKRMELAGWSRVDRHFRSMIQHTSKTKAGDEKAKRIESLWISPSAARA